MLDFHHLSQILIPVARAAEEAAAESSASGGLAKTLGIDWKLFLAQLVNFGVILFVLWKWVFKPVARKLGERTHLIEKSLTDAQKIEKEKQEFAQWREQEMSKTRKQASEIITQSQSEANVVKQQILSQTKQEQEKLLKQAQEQINQEKQHALSDIKSQVADMITLAAEKILKKHLDEKTDKELIKESLESIK